MLPRLIGHVLADAPEPDRLAIGTQCGFRTHPDDAVREATLIQAFYLLDEKTLWRRQWRGDTPVWQDPWEIVRYT